MANTDLLTAAGGTATTPPKPFWTRKPLVYIAAPYSSDPAANTHRAIKEGLALWASGQVAVIIPHLTLLADIVAPRPVNDWYRFDHDQLAACDAVLRLGGDSAGADGEVRLATDWGIPVFHSVGELLAAVLPVPWTDRNGVLAAEWDLMRSILGKLKAAGTAERSAAIENALTISEPPDLGDALVRLTPAEAAMFDAIGRAS